MKKKIALVFIVLAITANNAFAQKQQKLPSRIIGGIPSADSKSLYQIQVGAFLLARNVVSASNLLKSGGFDPELQNYLDLTRVLISRIPANEIIANLERLKKLGFNEVIIRKDQNSLTITEKWNVAGDQGTFSSFEFTQENRFIAVEREDNKAHYGEYNMPSQNIINMNNLGILRITTRNNDELSLSFSPVNEPSRVEYYTATKEAPMQSDMETDLFTRAWRIAYRAGSGTVKDGVKATETIGRIYLYSINGTYMVTRTDGSVAYISNWRWVDDSHEEFEYSHDNWQTYGRTKINTLNENSLITSNITSDDYLEAIPAITK